MAIEIQSMPKADFRERRIQRAKDGRIVMIRPAVSGDAAEIARRMARVVKEGIYLEEEPDTLPTGQEKKEEIRKIRENGGMYSRLIQRLTMVMGAEMMTELS